MCCFLLALFAFGPRLVIALEWIFGHRIQVVFTHWWWPLLGLVFAPWTTLMYTIVWSAGGVHGANWIAVGLGVLLDLFSYSGRRAQKMRQQRSAAYP
jgi:hypothetical protein